MYDEIKTSLRKAYDMKVEERQGKGTAKWKDAERRAFLALLQAEEKHTLLEIGAGTGVHGLFFHENGLEVVCTDLSSAMVASCRAKGLAAHVMDFLNLDFPARTFDAVFAMNCLLHVPHAEFGRVLESVRRVLKPGGVFFLGQYGGQDEEAVYENDHYEPKRFFAFWTDEQIEEETKKVFGMETFKVITLDDDGSDLHLQALVLRR